jgi:hypothetical protein
MPGLTPAKFTCQLSSAKCQRENIKCKVHALTTLATKAKKAERIAHVEACRATKREEADALIKAELIKKALLMEAELLAAQLLKAEE